MKLRFALLLCIGLLPVFSFGQGALTVFSEDGDKFFLFLNSVKQNSTPQANVRVDGLAAEFYQAKIVFEDPAKEAISKNIPTKDPGTHEFVDATYRIKHNNKGDLVMRYFGATPVPVNYVAPPDMYVAHYGAPAPATTVTQTTTTTTNTNDNMGNGGANINVNGGGNGGGSISIGAPGVNMNINISDPNNGNGGAGINMNVNPGTVNTTTTQTTTTRTYSNTTTDNGGYNNAPPPASAQCTYPMDFASFKSAKETIGKSSFEDTKLSTAKTIVGGNCVSSEQVMQICSLFSFEQTKVDFAKFAYKKCTDRGNYFKVGNIFTFDASKTELNDFISQQQ